MHGDVIARHDHLLYFDTEIGHGGAELARDEGRPLRPLWTSQRQRVISEALRDRLDCGRRVPFGARFVLTFASQTLAYASNAAGRAPKILGN
jgi:hypothetical protein